jgi:predicted HTH transcriptional regulator
VIPVVRTIFSQNEGKKRIGESSETTQKQRTVDKEKQILAVAQKERGKITPSLVALKTSLSIEEAEQVLQDLVRRGHASMEVLGDGRIEYRFPEFMSGGSSDSG